MYQFDRFHGIGDKQKVKIWRSRISRGYDKKKPLSITVCIISLT